MGKFEHKVMIVWVLVLAWMLHYKNCLKKMVIVCFFNSLLYFQHYMLKKSKTTLLCYDVWPLTSLWNVKERNPCWKSEWILFFAMFWSPFFDLSLGQWRNWWWPVLSTILQTFCYLTIFVLLSSSLPTNPKIVPTFRNNNLS